MLWMFKLLNVCNLFQSVMDVMDSNKIYKTHSAEFFYTPDLWSDLEPSELNCDSLLEKIFRWVFLSSVIKF